MLFKFRTKGFGRFRELTELDMLPCESDQHADHVILTKQIPFLKHTAVFRKDEGIDLSDAIVYSCNLILDRSDYSSKMPTDSSSTYFEYFIEIDGAYYTYGFEYNPSERLFLYEWLVELFPEDSDNENVLFEKNSNGSKSLYLWELRKEQNCLGEIALKIYNWFENNFVIVNEVSDCDSPDGKTFIVQSTPNKDLVKSVLESLSSISEYQTIVFTKDLELLSLDVFRRDEIWFVTGTENSSKIVPLSDFEENFDDKLESAYIEGRFH